MESFIGSICAFGFNFAPRGWAYCNGGIMAIQQNTALFALIGVQFGGNGTTTFGLPNLQGCAGVDQGQLAGGNNYTMGEVGGSESITVLTSNMPAHAHAVTLTLNGNARAADSDSPVNNFPAPSANTVNNYNTGASPSVFMKSPSITLSQAGGSQPIGISDPSLVMNYCIATSGIFPSRN